MDFLSIETGNMITLQESIAECEDFINRMSDAENVVNSPHCRIRNVGLTGYTTDGNVITLAEARAYSRRPALQVGDSWTDHYGCVNTIVPP